MEIPPGASVTERELARSTGFGLTPVRRALARLDHDGLLTTVPRAGYRVGPLDADAVTELVDAWSVVGPEVVRRGLDAVSGDDRAELEELLAERAASPGDDDTAVLRFSETSARVFEILADACGNRWLRSLSGQLSAQMSRVWVTLLRDAGNARALDGLVSVCDERVAGRPLTAVRDELPRVIEESGRLAAELAGR